MRASHRENRGLCVGPTECGKGTKWMVVGGGEGLPVGNHLNSASPAEVSLVFKALQSVKVPRRRGSPPTIRMG